MAAAYAAGLFSSTDAFRIAYYRDLCTTRHSGQTESGEKGSMLAVSHLSLVALRVAGSCC